MPTSHFKGCLRKVSVNVGPPIQIIAGSRTVLLSIDDPTPLNNEGQKRHTISRCYRLFCNGKSLLQHCRCFECVYMARYACRFCGVTADVRHETSLTSIPSVRPWKELQNLPISSLRLRSVVMATLSLNHMIHVAYHVPAFPRGLSTPESLLKPSSRTVVITTGIVFLYSLPFPGHLLLEWHLLIIN